MAKKYIDADTLWNRLISVSENDWVGFDTIDEVLSEMPAEPRWIPVTERLPEESGEYLVAIGSLICFSWFFKDDCVWSFNEVIAWMPLPSHYKGGAEE